MNNFTECNFKTADINHNQAVHSFFIHLFKNSMQIISLYKTIKYVIIKINKIYNGRTKTMF